MTEKTSHRQILRSSSIIGGASIINILIGLLRIKIVAVLLGPVGIGLIGLYGSIMSTVASVAGLGFGNAGTRQIAEAAGDNDAAAIAAVRRALFWGTGILAVLGGGVVWLARSFVAETVLGDASRAGDVGWLALGVSLTVASASQGALLNGLRRIGDLALISVIGALLSSVLGITVIVLWGVDGVIAYVVGGTLVGFFLSHYFVSKIERIKSPPTPFLVLSKQWGALAKLGFAFMVSGLLVTLGQFWVRILIQKELGTDALGQFQAAWGISMTYIGFVLAAMGADFYPRLTASIHDHTKANRLVNEQMEVALLIASPIFLIIISLAPWVVQLLYASSFGEAVSILRWQILGDILKIASWPIAFIILAAGDSRSFIITESIAISVFVAVVWLGLPVFGLNSTGMAVLAMYAVYLPIVWVLGKRRTGFSFSRANLLFVLTLFVAAFSIMLLAKVFPIGAAIFGFILAVANGLFSLWRLSEIAELRGVPGKIINLVKCVTGRQ